MSITDVLAGYGALLATAIAGWEVAKYFLYERPRLRLTVYAAEMVVPGSGAHVRNLLTYNIANTGGRAMVVTTLGGSLRSGTHFLITDVGLRVPQTLQPEESTSFTITMSDMPPLDQILDFSVHDAVGRRWTTSPEGVRKQIAARPDPKPAIP